MSHISRFGNILPNDVAMRSLKKLHFKTMCMSSCHPQVVRNRGFKKASTISVQKASTTKMLVKSTYEPFIPAPISSFKFRYWLWVFPFSCYLESLLQLLYFLPQIFCCLLIFGFFFSASYLINFKKC